MKKLLFLLFAIVLLSGCMPMVNQPKDITSIPIEVYQSLKADTIPVTMYMYESERYTYYFNEKKEITSSHYTGKGIPGNAVIPLFLFAILATMVVMLIMIGVTNK